MRRDKEPWSLRGWAKAPLWRWEVRLVATCWAQSQGLSTYSVLSPVPR